jgi:L-fuculose-phosphate aldolase
MDNTKALKKEMAYFMRRLYKKGLTTTTGGNISVRMAGGIVLITASQTDKGRMKADEIAMVDLHGRQLSAKLRPSMETIMHLAVYRHRADISCIVHAHPPLSTSFAASHQTIETALMGEAYAIVGKPALAPYAIMGSDELAQSVALAASKAYVLLMANHGVLAMGTSLLEAFDRIEVTENCARIELASRLLGGGKPIDSSELAAIDKLLHKE